MTAPVDSNAPLHALLANYPQYQGLLRDGAAKHFVVVSNADSGLPAASFLEQVAGPSHGDCSTRSANSRAPRFGRFI